MNKKKKERYLSIKTKFNWTMFITIAYLILCLFLNIWWFQGLILVFPIWYSIWTILGIAVCPGILMTIMICGVLFDKPRDHSILEKLPPITILIAAYNEEEGIYETLNSLSKQKYNGKISTFVIDNNSKDNTKSEILKAKKEFPDINIEYMFEKKQGKFNALNYGLAHTTTKYFVTLDADTILYKDALNRLLTTMVIESKNKKLASVVGAVLVRNSRKNLLTKLQEWDYFLSITGIKRSQGLFQSTLVAQGAYSVYNTQLVKDIGGWDDSIGEDIVLTWRFLAEGWITHYEPNSIAFTIVPETFKTFRRQRSRWARGMVEGLRQRAPWSYPSIYSKVLIASDILLFIIDFAIVFCWIPGIIMAFFGIFLIVGPLTLLLLPLTFLMFAILFYKERNTVFMKFGLKIRKHYFSFIIFLLTYQIIMAPISIIGYIQEFFHVKRKWK